MLSAQPLFNTVPSHISSLSSHPPPYPLLPLPSPPEPPNAPSHIQNRDHNTTSNNRTDAESVKSEGSGGHGRRRRNHGSSAYVVSASLPRVQQPHRTHRSPRRKEPSSHEVVQVEILNQDDNWCETRTALTGNTSEGSQSMEDLRWGKEDRENTLGIAFRCQRYGGSFLAALVVIGAAISPVAMLVLPKLGIPSLDRRQLECGARCDGLLLSAAFKLAALGLGTWALFWRAPRASLPRLLVLRALVLLLTFLLAFAFWLFFLVRLREAPEEIDYEGLAAFASSMLDALLFLHYLALLLIHLRPLQPHFSVKVIRSPDGESHSFNIGLMSIQRAAVVVLEYYYSNFPLYNPYLEQLPLTKGHKHHSSFKFYDLDQNSQHNGSQGWRSSCSRRKDSNHNERFYEEHEYERRVRKRRARLLTATEEAFALVRRLHPGHGKIGANVGLDPHESAQAIFPSLARPLQKYLRVTRQQPRHSAEAILNHLAACLQRGLGPRVFLEKFLITSPVLQPWDNHNSVQTWALVCEELASRSLTSRTSFQLRQGDVALWVTTTSLPHFNITEETAEPHSNRFVLRVSSETSV